MDELKNIEYAFKMFDLKTKALIYGFQKEVENGKKVTDVGKQIKRIEQKETYRNCY